MPKEKSRRKVPTNCKTCLYFFSLNSILIVCSQHAFADSSLRMRRKDPVKILPPQSPSLKISPPKSGSADPDVPTSAATASQSISPKELEQKKALLKVEELIEQENFLEAQEVFEIFSQIDVEQSSRLLVNKALIAKGLYKQNEAFELLKAALKLNDNYGPAQFEIALILMERKEWADAEVLLRFASASDDIVGQRRLMIPYYLGVIAFETGRLFEARSSFLKLSWNESLDPALAQSTGFFITKIMKQRAWNVISPLSIQYESNVKGLSRSALQESASQSHSGFKIIGGLFGSFEGLGGSKPGEGPLGLGLRLFAVQNLNSEYSALNIQFAEAEASVSKYLGPKLGLLKTALTGNYIRAGSRALSSTSGLKLTFFETDLNFAFENDLQRTASVNRTSLLFRIYREQQLMNLGRSQLSLPVDAGFKQPLKKEPGEKKWDVSLSPAMSYAFSRRFSAKVNGKGAYEKNSSNEQSSFATLRSGAGLSFAYNLAPFLVMSTNGGFDWDKNLQSNAIVQKGTVSVSFLGLL